MFTLKIDDGICKGFKNEEEIDVFINKAYDEETQTHALLIYIPKIPQFNILQLRQPIFYESQEERDRIYTELGDEFVNQFWQQLVNHITEQKEKTENDGNGN
jgi:hypothetical protein